MESEWDWPSAREIIKSKLNLKKEGINYELWKIWWTIRATRIKGKTR